ncbi:hypothetical protein [Rhizobium sp. NXC24]|uniref:hypothetical protein n=1 Tax=Rhizobium sp. NXC24 TaxID=2048897 RepID=UPI000CF2A4E1|nr:hypothetical protein [Rhizobium sp. NXC24]
MSEYSLDTYTCESCKCAIVVNCVWEPGGMNDYGGFIVQCRSCNTIQEIYVGRDVNSSSIRSGAILLGRYDRDLEGDRETTRQRHGLD